MARIDSNAELKEAIQVLESKQKEDLKSLKKEFEDVKDRLKPKNLLKQGLSKVSKSPALKTTLIVAAAGLISMFAIKKFRNRRRKQHEKKMQLKYGENTSAGGRKTKKMSTSIIQYLITVFLSRNADKLKDFVFKLLSNIKTSPPKHTQTVHSDTATSAASSIYTTEKQKTGY